eukprot:8122462-Karenia_brevis.AAC.1
MRRMRRVARHAGKPIINGGFAVPKDELEDRLISADVPINQLLDSEKLPRPRFAYIPRLRVVRSDPRKVIRVTKRDARHYFHMLRLGKRWRKYLSNPPVEVSKD